MNTELMFSSKKSDWGTPIWLYNFLDEEFHLGMDAACSRENMKGSYGLTEDSLETDWLQAIDARWHGTNRSVFLNPPYGKDVGKWVKKAYEESQKGCVVVCLLPSRTDTKWFHDYIGRWACEVRFLSGRLKFEGANHPAPFPSVVVVFRQRRRGNPSLDLNCWHGGISHSNPNAIWWKPYRGTIGGGDY